MLPASRINNAGPIPISQFDLIGQDGFKPFVRHVGLAGDTGAFAPTGLAVKHMGPPLESTNMNCDVLGTAELAVDEVRLVALFVDRNQDEHDSRQLAPGDAYCVHPHVDPVRADDGTIEYFRYSCAGFAVMAYAEADIQLLDLAALPAVTLDTIADAYPDHAQVLRRRVATRAKFGLTGNGPWPVLMCGYLFHSLKRPIGTLRTTPYVPVAADIDFV